MNFRAIDAFFVVMFVALILFSVLLFSLYANSPVKQMYGKAGEPPNRYMICGDGKCTDWETPQRCPEDCKNTP